MILKYNIEIEDKAIFYRVRNLINQIYKLLPIRQQGADWQKLLETIIEELTGMQRLMLNTYSEIFFPLLNKLEGLYSLTEEKDFSCYRRIIFQCLNLLNELQKKICPQKY